jgi:hypothetical protein
MRRLVVLVVLAALSSVTSAEGLSKPPSLTEPEPAPSTLAPPTEPGKSPTTAVILSAGTSLLGMAMVSSDSDGAKLFGLLTMYVGPTTGLWYGGDIGWPGLVARLVAAGLVVKGLEHWENAELIEDCIADAYDDCSNIYELSDRELRKGDYMVWGGIGIWAASTVVDIALAHRAARKWNERNISVAPTFNGGPGLALGMKF